MKTMKTMKTIIKKSLFLLILVFGSIMSMNSQTSQTLTETFCQGTGIRPYAVDTAEGTNGTPGSSYSWSITGTNSSTAVLSAAIGNPISINWSATPAGSYVVHVVETTTATGCIANEVTLNVTINPLPTATITPVTATTFCSGGSVVLNANTGTGLTYQWQLDGVNYTGTGATTSSITATTSGVYTVIVTNASTCSATSSGTTVTVNALPTATITPVTTTTFCNGGSVVLDANTGTGLTYQWQLDGVNYTGTGATTSSITATTSGVYTVIVTNASTCSATSSGTTVTVNALPTATITPVTTTTFCSGGSVVLNANTGTGLTYQWQLDGVNYTGTGAITSSITATTSGVYTVIVTNASTCSATSSGETVTVTPAPTATITAATTTSFCVGGSVVLDANIGTGLTYQWQLDGVNYTGTGATTSSITATTSGVYTVIVTNTSTCSATSSGTTVTVNALPTATITPVTATTFCSGGSVVLNANTGTGLTYQWQLDGVNYTGAGATTSSITAATSGIYTVIVTNASTCSATSLGATVTVNPAPTTSAIFHD